MRQTLLPKFFKKPKKIPDTPCEGRYPVLACCNRWLGTKKKNIVFSDALGDDEQGFVVGGDIAFYVHVIKFKTLTHGTSIYLSVLQG